MRIGIVGAGSMGQAHAAGWSEAGADIVGIVSSNRDSSEALAKEHDSRAFSSYADLLAQVDVVGLCVPTDLHRDMTIEAAEAGTHVVCEKPMALSVEDCRSMIDACERSGVRLFVAHVLRFFPQYRAAADAVMSGRIGDLGVMRLKRVSYPPRGKDRSWFADEARSGGMVFDLMIHDFDYARWLGGKVGRVFAKSVRASRPDLDGDYALVTLRFESGAMALVEGGWAHPPGVFRTGFDLAGPGGAIEWSSDDTEPIRSYLEAAPGEAADVGLPLTVLTESPYTTEILHVHRALTTGEPFLVNPEDALEAVRLCLAARLSLREGRPVALSEIG